MVTKVDAYQDCYGGFHKTKEEAEKAEITVAVDHMASLEKNHLMNVMTGHSTSEQTRNAIRLLADRLPPLCSPAPEIADAA
jgi:hypothetical protein